MTNDLIDTTRMLTIPDVVNMLKISKVALWRLSNSKNEDKRLPSYKVGGKRLYKYDELMWYLDKHKTTPSQSGPPRRKQ